MNAVKRCLIGSMLAVLCAFTAAPASAKVYIDIHSPSATQFPIVIAPFVKTGGAPDSAGTVTTIAGTIAGNLAFSGFFRVLDPAALDGRIFTGVTRDKIRWDRLAIIGAEALVTGSCSFAGKDRFSTELRLFDSVQAKFITGKKYEGTTADARLVAHKFSNEIFRRLTGTEGVFETKIAYVKNEGGAKEIFISDFDGHNPTKVTRYRSLSLSPAWSPDGKKIAFTSYKDGNPDLYIQDLYTATIKKASHKKGINISPCWSPDGKRIALTLSLNNGNSEIYVLTADTGNLERMTHDWATDVSPAWSPDGKKIAFVSSRAGGPQLYCLTLKTGKVTRLTYEGSYNTSPAWSPRGDVIAYTRGVDAVFNICLISVDGTYARQLTTRGSNEDPSWSPDGRFITFSSNRTGRKEIYIMRSDGANQQRITQGKGAKTDPAWGPF